VNLIKKEGKAEDKTKEFEAKIRRLEQLQ